MGKLTKNRVLWGGAGLCRTSRERDGVRKFFSSCRAGQGWGKIKPCGAGAKAPSFGSAPPYCHPYLSFKNCFLFSVHFGLPNKFFSFKNINLFWKKKKFGKNSYQTCSYSSIFFIHFLGNHLLPKIKN